MGTTRKASRREGLDDADVTVTVGGRNRIIRVRILEVLSEVTDLKEASHA